MIRILFALLLLPAIATASGKPDLLLAGVYNDNIDVSHYWVSEKLDGIRAYWNGSQLISRNGHVFAAPHWFTRDFPAIALDGELWLARGQFEKTVSIVRKQQPIDSEWQQLAFYVFELPEGNGTFSERLHTLQHIVNTQNNAHLKLIPQLRVETRSQLFEQLNKIVSEGGEGLMLHHQDALYTTGRSGDLLKLKIHNDAEAVVTGYRPGKGKYQGLTGALVVTTAEGLRFAIGSGLSDKLRHNPPAIGTVITYQYNGLSRNGIPRFARFLRIREEP